MNYTLDDKINPIIRCKGWSRHLNIKIPAAEGTGHLCVVRLSTSVFRAVVDLFGKLIQCPIILFFYHLSIPVILSSIQSTSRSGWYGSISMQRLKCSLSSSKVIFLLSSPNALYVALPISITIERPSRKVASGNTSRTLRAAASIMLLISHPAPFITNAAAHDEFSLASATRNSAAAPVWMQWIHNSRLVRFGKSVVDVQFSPASAKIGSFRKYSFAEVQTISCRPLYRLIISMNKFLLFVPLTKKAPNK